MGSFLAGGELIWCCGNRAIFVSRLELPKGQAFLGAAGDALLSLQAMAQAANCMTQGDLRRSVKKTRGCFVPTCCPSCCWGSARCCLVLQSGRRLGLGLGEFGWFGADRKWQFCFTSPHGAVTEVGRWWPLSPVSLMGKLRQQTGVLCAHVHQLCGVKKIRKIGSARQFCSLFPLYSSLSSVAESEPPWAMGPLQSRPHDRDLNAQHPPGSAFWMPTSRCDRT